MRRWREKLGLRRPRHLPDADEGGEEHEAESTSDLERKSDQQMLQLPHVQLHFASDRTASADAEISEARIFLQKSVEELESVLQAQLGQSSDKLQSNLGAYIAQDDTTRPAEPFKNVLAAVQEDRADRNQAATSRAGAVMQKMYPLTKLALGLTGTLTSSAGYAPVQIVTNGLTQAFDVSPADSIIHSNHADLEVFAPLQIAMSVPKQSEEVVAGLDSMAADDYLLAELQKMPGDLLDGPIVLGAIVLQTRLVEFLRKSILWLKKTFFATFANCLIEPAQMTDARTELKKAQDALKSQLSVDAYLTMKWQKIATVQAELLNSLCSNEYHTAHLLKQKELHSTRLKDSGMWAVTDEKFKNWHGDAGGILWCPGLPGAGKTYLASRIVDELQSAGRHRDVGVAHVYCEYNRAQQQSDKLVIEAMIRQLIAQKPNICFEFRHFLENPLATTLDDRKKLLRQVLTQFETTFLVLDALDEFSTEYSDRHRLACTLRDIIQERSTRQVRLCITSREADGIWQALSSSTAPAKILDVRSSRRDIRALVEQVYDEASHDRAIGWTYGNDELRRLVIEKVVQKSDCIFKLADLQIRAILREPSAKLAKSALEHLTKNVNDYYIEAMERIASQTETKDMVYNLLTWLTFTRSPIHFHELELALSIRPGQSLDHDFDDQRVDVLRYVSLSEGLVSINNSNRPYEESSEETDWESGSEIYTMNEHKLSISKDAQVTLAHDSIREFLSDTPQPGIPANGDKFLLHCCLTIMSSPIFVEDLHSIRLPLIFERKWPGFARDRFGECGFSYFGDADLTPDMTNAIQKIYESSAVLAVRGAWRVEEPTWPPRNPGPLHWCAYEGWATACKSLLPLEEDPNARCVLEPDIMDVYGPPQTCLFAAVASGDIPTVKIFLDDDRVDPNLGAVDGIEHVTPLMQACKQNHRDIVRMLLARTDVDVNTYDDNGGYGVGLPAILRAKPGTMALLLERDDLDVNILRLGRRPIHHLASIGGPPSVLELLLDNVKTDVNGRKKESISMGGRWVDVGDIDCFRHGRTALMVAAFVGQPAQTSVLLKHPRIDLQLRDPQGMTPLMLASVGWEAGTLQDIAELQASSQQHDETVRILLTSSDSAINERDVRGRTALIFASMGGVDPRWDGSTRSCEGLGGLGLEYRYENLAANASLGKRHHIEIVKALLTDGKVDVNIPDNMGHTALDYAMWTRDFIIQERIVWEMQSLKKELESPLAYNRLGVPSGFYLVPDVDVQDIMNGAQSGIDAMSKIHDILVASGAHSGEPIATLAIPRYRQHKGFSYEPIQASGLQSMLESVISALESVV